MEVSADVLDGLQIIGDSARIPDSCYANLIEDTCSCLASSTTLNIDDEPYSRLDRGTLKQGYAGLATFLLEAAKLDKETSSLSHVLEDCKFSPDRISALEKIYLKHKDQLRHLLSKFGTDLPRIIDVDWRLDYYIKSSQVDRVNEPNFLIKLKTVNPGEKYSDVQFSCNQEQLQDLVGKLKEVCKSLERAGQM